MHLRLLSKYYFIWNIIIVFCSAVFAVILPLNLVFPFHYSSDIFISLLISFIFIADIFFTASGTSKIFPELLLETRQFSNFYIKKLLIFDIISAIPFELIFPDSWPQLFRLLKLIKVAYLMDTWRQSIIQFSNLLRFVFFAFWILIAVHWISCLWTSLRGNILNQDWGTVYVKSLYWTITTLTTVGYGDITPETNVQRIFAICVMFLGIGIYGYLIGNIAGMLAKRDPSKTNYLGNLEKLNALVHFRKIPVELQNKIRNYYRYMWKQKLGYDESVFLEGLPEGLRKEVSLNLKKESVEKIPLFKNGGQEFISEIAMHLKPVVFTPGEYIFKAGDEGKEMYFVVNGSMEIRSRKDNHLLNLFTSGDFFGEIALVKNKPRTAHVIAASYCDLYSLSKNSFDYVLSRYPVFAQEIEKIIKEREEREELENF
ncbi:MAG TPA: cyclic nucleotide-binding domain-containing protein [Ignavibacteriaceae bacterium]|nr:cyclic nucleotide-binding domain-containing protein [Ignavibacteriaceae bacterium]